MVEIYISRKLHTDTRETKLIKPLYCNVIRKLTCDGLWSGDELSVSVMSFGNILSAELLWVLQRRELLLSFAAFGCGNPSALNVGLTRKPSGLTAGPASEMCTIFLGLVTTVLTVNAAASCTSGPHDS